MTLQRFVFIFHFIHNKNEVTISAVYYNIRGSVAQRNKKKRRKKIIIKSFYRYTHSGVPKLPIQKSWIFVSHNMNANRGLRKLLYLKYIYNKNTRYPPVPVSIII